MEQQSDANYVESICYKTETCRITCYVISIVRVWANKIWPGASEKSKLCRVHKYNFVLSEPCVSDTYYSFILVHLRRWCHNYGDKCDSARDLGVTISRDLSPSLHISNIVAKAHKRAAAIYRAFRSRNVDLLIRAYPVSSMFIEL